MTPKELTSAFSTNDNHRRDLACRQIVTEARRIANAKCTALNPAELSALDFALTEADMKRADLITMVENLNRLATLHERIAELTKTDPSKDLDSALQQLAEVDKQHGQINVNDGGALARWREARDIAFGNVESARNRGSLLRGFRESLRRLEAQHGELLPA